MLNRGDIIGQFVLLNKVGSGGFGDVWKAEKRTALDVNYFALKFFRPKDDRIDYDKISKELGVWKQLRGLPHIISVIELDRFDDYVYVVSDFADGGSLENWLKDKPSGKASSQAEAVKITLEILRGLENLHEKGFVHRDLKPDNILIMNGKFCLTDFGVSREIKTHSKATGTAGTMEYMPPEAFEKTPSITQQTDIWAVGVILQKLLTGELPYPQEDYPSLVSAILMYEPDEMPADVPEGLREIVKKALQKQSANRFRTAREMLEALKNPNQFLAEKDKKKKDSETIIDEDFDKTELLEIPVTEDWRKIEAEKAEKLAEEQRRHEEAEKEHQRKLAEANRLKEAEEARRLREIEAKRRQDEQDEIQRRLKPQPPDQSSNLWKWIVGGVGGFVLFVFGILGLSSLSNNNNSTVGNNVNRSAINATNRQMNTATNKLANTSTTSGNSDSFKNSIGMEFAKIPAGWFMMGGDKSDDEKPVHKVTISNDFYMGKYEVTQAQWKAVMGSLPTKCDFGNLSGDFLGDNKPIICVNWDDAQEFINKLNAKSEGTYRLPTEAEWEYAARAGTTGDYAGNLDSMAWYSVNSGSKTHEVGTKQKNDWGLYDMHGNVWEWCEDWHGAYSSSAQTDPTGATSGSARVFRGGSWFSVAVDLRSADRFGNTPSLRSVSLGFRVVRN